VYLDRFVGSFNSDSTLIRAPSTKRRINMEHLRHLPLEEQYVRTEAERARLEAVVLEQMKELRKLARKNESLELRNREMGKSNVALNKEVGRLSRKERHDETPTVGGEVREVRQAVPDAGQPSA
jgi:hypothetical protein